MDLIWIVIVLFAAGYLGSRFAFAKERLPAVVRDTFLTGWEFILIGMALGPLGFDLVDAAKLAQLTPLVALGLAWAGLIFGVQMRLADLKKVERPLLKLTLFQSIATGAGLFVVYLALAWGGGSVGWSQGVASAFIVAAAGAVSSPTALALMGGRFPRTAAPLLRRLSMIANLDLAPALVIVGAVFCFFPAGMGGVFAPERGATLLFFSILIALAMAGLFHYFGRRRLLPEEELTVLLGFLAFLAGVAFYLKLSPLFLALTVGVALANTLAHDDPIFTTLFATEKPFYVMLLIVAGLLWTPTGPLPFVVAAAVLSARLWLKGSTTRLGARRWLRPGELPPDAGLALAAQGALALAIGVNYVIVYPGFAAELAFGVIALTTVVNEIVAPAMIRRAVGGGKEAP